MADHTTSLTQKHKVRQFAREMSNRALFRDFKQTGMPNLTSDVSEHKLY
jgi:hypothetical protein